MEAEDWISGGSAGLLVIKFCTFPESPGETEIYRQTDWVYSRSIVSEVPALVPIICILNSFSVDFVADGRGI